MSLSFLIVFKIFLALLFFLTFLWLFSLYLKDVSLIDRFWGMTFAFQSLCYSYFLDFQDNRLNLLTLLIVLWGGRLFFYLSKRAKGKEEDYRYKAIRELYSKEKFWWYSLFIIFYFQGVLSFIVAAPIIFIFMWSSQSSLSIFDYIGFLGVIIGFFIEVIADKQLSSFKEDIKNKGKVCTTGLWSLSRHPNYLGEIILWWGLFIITLSFPYGFLSFYGPALMTYLLINVSGAKLVEKRQVKQKKDYASYIEKVPAIFPNIKDIFKFK